jgi:hypothetical protein
MNTKVITRNCRLSWKIGGIQEDERWWFLKGIGSNISDACFNALAWCAIPILAAEVVQQPYVFVLQI